MNKKAQEEMVGFVLIMLLVAVVFVVFLGIYLRNAVNAEPTDSTEISQFLEASFEVTTKCGEPFPKKIHDVITMCSEGISSCPTTGENPCVLLKDSMKNIIDSGWVFSENSSTKGYVLSITQRNSQGVERAVINATSKGDISGRQYRSATKPLPDGIEMKLDIYV